MSRGELVATEPRHFSEEGRPTNAPQPGGDAETQTDRQTDRTPHTQKDKQTDQAITEEKSTKGYS